MAGSVRLGPLGVLHVAHVLEGCNGIGKCLSLVIRADAGAGLSRLGTLGLDRAGNSLSSECLVVAV